MYAGAKHHWVQYMNPKSTFSMLCVCFDSHVDLNIEGCLLSQCPTFLTKIETSTTT